MELNSSDRSARAPIFDLPQYRNRTRIFQSRREAAEMLAGLLPSWIIHTKPVLLAVSTYGYTVATLLARRFELELKYMPVQNVCLPWDNEVDYAAVAFDGTTYLDQDMIEHNRLGRHEIDKGIARARDRVRCGVAATAADSLRNLRSGNVLLVDESIATGVVVRAAVMALESYHVMKPSLAVVTAHDRALGKLDPVVKYIFCANIRSGYSYSVDDAYKQSVVNRVTGVSGQPANGIRLDSLSA